MANFVAAPSDREASEALASAANAANLDRRASSVKARASGTRDALLALARLLGRQAAIEAMRSEPSNTQVTDPGVTR